MGECVLVVEDEELIKVHVHSSQPGHVLNLAQEYGQFIDMKIENMRVQEAGLRDQGSGPAAAEKAFGIVAIANGDGLVNMYREIGVDQIVPGGQSMNPSTEDILRAVNQVPAAHVLILPNNKNIIMAAEQAAQMSARKASVVPTQTVAEGVAAALEFDPEESAEDNLAQMRLAAGRVQTGLVTYAARESKAGGLNIREGAVIGLENGELTLTENDPVTAAYLIARRLVERHDGGMVTCYAGRDVTQGQSDALADKLRRHFGGDVDVAMVDGGQPMYFFIIAVE